jgi:AcrR family transcriptional regulator
MSVDTVGVRERVTAGVPRAEADTETSERTSERTSDRPVERVGLRERKKRATRQALHSAALRLVAERGLDEVTIEEIASAAEVSPRTFFNYFGSKEDVIVNPDPDRVERLRAALQAHESDEPPLAVLEAVMLDQLGEVTDRREEWLLRLRLVREIPALTPRHLAAFDAMERVFVEDVARRLHRDPVADVQPSLIGAVAMAALRSAIARWSAGDGHRSLPQLTREAFASLRLGLT